MREHRKKRVVIIGGSHSGFSSAWMLLNGPADLLHNAHETSSATYQYRRTGNFQFPDAVFKTLDNCARCCTCHLVKKAKKGPKVKCQCICRCFGFFKYQDWGFDYKNDLLKFDEGDIKIIYRDKIRVFYS